MRLEHAKRSEAVASGSGRETDTPCDVREDWLLGLQATAGNAAVARLLESSATTGPRRGAAAGVQIQRMPGEEAAAVCRRLKEKYGGFLQKRDWIVYGAEYQLSEICRRAATEAEAEERWKAWLYTTMDTATAGGGRRKRQQAETKKELLKEKDKKQEAELEERRKKRKEREEREAEGAEGEPEKKRARNEPEEKGKGAGKGLGERREAAFYKGRVDARFSQLLGLSEAAVHQAQIAEGLLDKNDEITTKGFKLLKERDTSQPLSTAEMYFYIANYKPVSTQRGVNFAENPLVSMPVTSTTQSLRGGRIAQTGKYSQERGWDPRSEQIGGREQGALMRRGVAAIRKLVADLATDVEAESRSEIEKHLTARHFLQRLEHARFPASAVADALAVIGVELDFWTMGEYFKNLMPMRGEDATTVTQGVGGFALMEEDRLNELLTTGNRALREVLDTTKTVFKRFIEEVLKPANRRSVEKYPALVTFLGALLDLLELEEPQAADLERGRTRLAELSTGLLRSPERSDEPWPFLPASAEKEEKMPSSVASFGPEFGGFGLSESGSFLGGGGSSAPSLGTWRATAQPSELGGADAVVNAKRDGTVIDYRGQRAIVLEYDMGGSSDVHLLLGGGGMRVPAERVAELFPAGIPAEVQAGRAAVQTSPTVWHTIVGTDTTGAVTVVKFSLYG